MVQCAACGKFMAVKDGVACPQCNSHSHYECMMLPIGAKVSKTWKCGDCQIKTPKGRGPSTPIRGHLEGYKHAPCDQSRGEPMAMDDTAHDITAEFSEAEGSMKLRSLSEEMRAEFFTIRQLMTTEFSSFREEMRALSNDMQDFKKEITSLRADVVTCNKRIDEIDARVAAIEQTVTSSYTTDIVSALESTICDLKMDLNNRDQEALLNDVEITGLPEESGENLPHIVSLLATKMGMSLDQQDLVSVERTGSTFRNVEEREGAVQSRPRRIVVRFARRVTRDAYLQAARVRRGITSQDLIHTAGAGPSRAPVRIYVNERLTKVNRQLFGKTREECRRLGWRYCWTKAGKIFVRKEHGSSGSRVRSDSDLKIIFTRAGV